MLGLLPVATLLLVAAEIGADATLVTEARGGEAPLQAGGPSRAGVVGVLTPGGGLELRRSDSLLRLEYGARIFWRQPNDSGSCPAGMITCVSTERSSRLSPLILHVVSLTGTARTSERVNLTGGVSMSIGEADYTTLPLLVAATGGATQATLPAVIDIFSVTARAGALVAVTRIWTAGLLGEVSHRRPIGSEGQQDPANPDASRVILPRQTSIRGEPTAVARLSRQDDLLLMSAVSYQTYSQTISNGGAGDTSYLVVTPEVGWRTHLSRRYDLRLVGGVAYLKIFGTPATGRTPPPITPIGNAEFQGRPYRYEGIALQLNLGFTLDYYVDPILAVAAPRGTASARCNALFWRNWSAGIEGMFATNLTGSPLRGTVVDETVASVAIPIRHRASDHFIVEFGGRWSDRGPHLNAPSFAFHQRELWAYVVLTATTRRQAQWTAPP